MFAEVLQIFLKNWEYIHIHQCDDKKIFYFQSILQKSIAKPSLFLSSLTFAFTIFLSLISDSSNSVIALPISAFLSLNNFTVF